MTAAVTGSSVEQARPGEIVARAGTYYRVARYVLGLALVAVGCWYIHDGFIGYPRANLAWALDHPYDKPPHSDMDLLLQKTLGIVLPPAGVFLVIWAVYRSRGAYRLADGVLHVPGHEPIPLRQIEEVDKSKWDRKGIAFVTYRTSNDKQRTFRLDDFIYEQKPINQIRKQIEATLAPPTAIEDVAVDEVGADADVAVEAAVASAPAPAPVAKSPAAMPAAKPAVAKPAVAKPRPAVGKPAASVSPAQVPPPPPKMRIPPRPRMG